MKGFSTSAMSIQNWKRTSRNDEEDKCHDGADSLHLLSTVLLVVHEECGKVISCQLAPYVDEVIKPECSHLITVRRDDGKKDVAKDLIAVKWKAIAEPAQTRGEQAMPVMIGNEIERCDVVASNVASPT